MRGVTTSPWGMLWQNEFNGVMGPAWDLEGLHCTLCITTREAEGCITTYMDCYLLQAHFIMLHKCPCQLRWDQIPPVINDDRGSMVPELGDVGNEDH